MEGVFKAPRVSDMSRRVSVACEVAETISDPWAMGLLALGTQGKGARGLEWFRPCGDEFLLPPRWPEPF